jgi:PHD/YefM family antitoxin component YafN of YafNO toxin-antitoxin module
MAAQAKTPKRVVHHIPITKARTNLGQVVRRAHLNRECFVLEKDGIPVAGLMNVDDMEDWLELQDPGMRKQIAEGYAAYQLGDTTSLDDFLAEVKKPKPRRKKGA